MAGDQDLPNDEQELARRLREEALRWRPEFSASLHARLMAAVREAGLGTGRPGRPPRRLAIGVRWSLAVALAAGLLVAAAVAWQLAKGPRAGPSPKDIAIHDPPLPERNAHVPDAPDPMIRWLAAADVARGAVGLVDGLANQAIVAHQWAYLDHDAKVAFDLLVDRIPLDAIAALAAAHKPKG